MATSGGISDGLKLAGKINDHLAQAVKSDLEIFVTRWELSQFYLPAPSPAERAVA